MAALLVGELVTWGREELGVITELREIGGRPCADVMLVGRGWTTTVPVSQLSRATDAQRAQLGRLGPEHVEQAIVRCATRVQSHPQDADTVFRAARELLLLADHLHATREGQA